jgi:hypothetical protein
MAHKEANMRCETKEPKTAGNCGPCSPAVRNRYFRGKLLTVTDYQAEQRYMIERRRLVSRAVLGWGIVSGFGVDGEAAALTVAPGIAFDHHGRELVLCEPFRVCDKDDLVWLRSGKCGLEASDDGRGPGRYLLAAHYAECRIDGVRINDGCGEVVCETNRMFETVVFSLRLADVDCPPFTVQDCRDLAPRDGQQPADIASGLPYVAPVDDRGVGTLCRQRDDWPYQDNGGADKASRPCRDGPCRGDFDPCHSPRLSTLGCCDIDFDAGVPLAYVEIKEGDCGLVFGAPVAIIGCCALTRIKDIGWRNWHARPGTEVAREQFDQMFVAPASAAGGGIPKKPDGAPVDTHFWVCLTGPVQVASLTSDAVTVTLAQADSREAVWNLVQVPVTRFWYADPSPGDPKGTTRGFRITFESAFWWGEIFSSNRSGFENPTRVEIRIHGDAIIDWAGRSVDGTSQGRSLPSGNGTPGGDFVSSWLVKNGGQALPAYALLALTDASTAS